MPIPDFDDLADLLPPECDAHPSEWHGFACGTLAAGFAPAPEQWLRLIAGYAGFADTGTSPDAAGNALLSALLDSSLEALQRGEFDLRLCLPDDDVYALDERCASLARWCQGFLHGFAAVQRPLGPESRELLADLAEIARLEAESFQGDESEGEDNEGAYAELAEFVRMAATSLFMETRHASAQTGVPARH